MGTFKKDNPNDKRDGLPMPSFDRTGKTLPLSAQNRSDEAPLNLNRVIDLPVTMTVELGRTKIAVRNLSQLVQGSVVELDGLAGEPMDVSVNGQLIAQGEVVVVNDKFGIRLTDIITPAERIRRLRK